MKRRSDAWFARQEELCFRALAEADRTHTPEEIAAAHAALAVSPDAPQGSMFTAAPNAGVATGGQPEPAGLASATSKQASRRTA
ncbi:hypothetical protein ACO2Q2_17125 [Dyella sp. KRB-257]|uniref:hypothetical protein n=1 Tax=Dyella sp. KRB-257 TaxID=3400915 RepID=UPI003BFC7EAA